MQQPANEFAPWFSIWLHPRQTIQQIVNTDPGHNLIILSMLLGAAQALRYAADNNAADFMPLAFIGVVIFVTGAITGPLALYLSASILHWVSSRFEGQASLLAVRAAIIWPAMPVIFGLVLWPPLITWLGPELFSAAKPVVEASPVLGSVVALFAIGQSILLVWAFVLQILCLSQVTQLSPFYGVVFSIVPIFIFRVFTSTAVVALLTMG